MTQNLFFGNSHQQNGFEQRLDNLERLVLQYRLTDGLFGQLVEIGCQVNELLQYRISYADRQLTLKLIKRVKYLQLLYFKTAVKLRASNLSKELKEQVSHRAWQIFLRWDELREIERSTLSGNNQDEDYHQDLLSLQLELKTKLTQINLISC